MANAKQMAREVLDQLPDDTSFAEIAYHLRVRELIEEGRRDLREGRTYSHEEVERDLAQWLARKMVGPRSRRPASRRCLRRPGFA